ncbi:hypothetical protein ACP26L_15760 [Paenibacillus sp. S-38]|uniref:hypothetical protein n=1 Tax=Paenibacillus sp. S-38 TaxID=3416710 RepID=UPI003CF85704
MRKLLSSFCIILCLLVLSGCNDKNIYSGIEKDNIQEISKNKNIEFVHEYKGSGNHWAAIHIVYKIEGEEKHKIKHFIKYIGGKPKPTGQISYTYETVGNSGSGSFVIEKPKDDIYSLGSTESNGAIPLIDSVIKMEITWNGNTEELELKISPEGQENKPNGE